MKTMTQRIITVGTFPYSRAMLLQIQLQTEGIDCFLVPKDSVQPIHAADLRVQEKDVAKSISLIDQTINSYGVAKEKAFRNMTMEFGYKKEATLDIHEGGSIIFMDGVAKHGETIPVKEVYVEGRAITANGNIVIQDRQALSTDGIFIVILPISRKGELFADKIEVVTRGVVYVKESQDLLNQAKSIIKKTIGKNVQKNNLGTIKKKIEQEMERFFYNKSKVNPIIIVHTVTI